MILAMAVLRMLMLVAVFVVGLSGWPFAHGDLTWSRRTAFRCAYGRLRVHFCGAVDAVITKTWFRAGINE
jgi:hypothetical protein